jgi:hypothetical protein
MTLDCVLLKDSDRTFVARLGALNQSLSLLLSTSRTTPPCQMLVVHPAFNLVVDILIRDTKGRIRSYKLLSGAVPCVLVDIFISIYHGMSRDPVQPCSVLGRDIIQCRWHCSTSEDIVLAARVLSGPPGYQSKYCRTSLAYPEFQFNKRRLILHIRQPERL